MWAVQRQCSVSPATTSFHSNFSSVGEGRRDAYRLKGSLGQKSDGQDVLGQKDATCTIRIKNS